MSLTTSSTNPESIVGLVSGILIRP
ncbi:hypothetical protein CAEBREN_14059 [Caenorhabditis brenneri]|uniref:Uncharacterized protein n=1 Tax=Caenorhabditis brenneri TaxID=135651 RepID=G0N0Y7_CAEBE|nr:hypothetical protein CAEBREN_14059 [Caenorhabditis brenneri]